MSTTVVAFYKLGDKFGKSASVAQLDVRPTDDQAVED